MNEIPFDQAQLLRSYQTRQAAVEVAMQTMYNSSPCMAAKSGSHAVMVVLKSSTQNSSIHSIDTYFGAAISGDSADGSNLVREIKMGCLDLDFDKEADNLSMAVLENQVECVLINRVHNQYHGRRPFGAGILLVGIDSYGTHVVKASPDAIVSNRVSAAIGAGSEKAKAYFDRCEDNLASSSLDQLCMYAMAALRETLPGEENLDMQKVTVAVIGNNLPFQILESKTVAKHLKKISKFSHIKSAPQRQ